MKTILAGEELRADYEPQEEMVVINVGNHLVIKVPPEDAKSLFVEIMAAYNKWAERGR